MDRGNLRRVQRLVIAIVLCAWVASGQAVAGAATYVEGLEDLPLMPGLTGVAGAGIAFDKPSGRIVEAYASGRLDRQAIFDFYRASLAELGWTQVGPGSFVRDGEKLELEVLGTDGDVVVRYSLSPD